MNLTGVAGLAIGALAFLVLNEPARPAKKVDTPDVPEQSLLTSLKNVFKNPLSRYITIAGSLRHT